MSNCIEVKAYSDEKHPCDRWEVRKTTLRDVQRHPDESVEYDFVWLSGRALKAIISGDLTVHPHGESRTYSWRYYPYLRRFRPLDYVRAESGEETL